MCMILTIKIYTEYQGKLMLGIVKGNIFCAKESIRIVLAL